MIIKMINLYFYVVEKLDFKEGEKKEKMKKNVLLSSASYMHI
jgi:hypothetical protein